MLKQPKRMFSNGVIRVCLTFFVVVYSFGLTAQGSSSSPRVRLAMLSDLPNNAKGRANVRLQCSVEKAEFPRLVAITLAERTATTVRKLSSINFMLPNCVDYPLTKTVKAKGELKLKSGYLEVNMTTGEEDVEVQDYICSATYMDSALMPKTVETQKERSYLQLFSLLSSGLSALQNENKKADNEIRRLVQSLSAAQEQSMAELLHPTTDCETLRETRRFVYPHQKVTLGDGTQVLCDMETDDGGWTIFQRRFNGKVNFYRGWDDYAKGFGDLDTDFWLGLDNLNRLAKRGPHELRVDLTFKGKKYYARYSTFNVKDATANYTLNVGGYSGNAGDSLASMHNSMQFSTFDEDHDRDGANCAVLFRGGWWYKSCHHSNLNGEWGSKDYGQGVNWKDVTGHHDSASFTEMKLRLLK